MATTGSGQIYPYRIAQADSLGNPTSTILDITNASVLKKNVSSNNSVLPVGTWPTTAELPDGSPGNHFVRIRFSHDLKAASILSTKISDQSNSGLTGAIQVLAYNPATESTSFVSGQGFVGGYTNYLNAATGKVELVQAVTWDNGLQVLDSRASGFPTGFTGSESLVAPNTFVFVPDDDNDLDVFDTFPAGQIIKIVCTPAVLDYRDRPLVTEVKTATTVGADTIAPEVVGWSQASTGGLQIQPANGAVGVSPLVTLKINFSKPVQPRDVGTFFSTTNLVPSERGLNLSASVSNTVFSINYYADPISHGDLTTYYVRPAYPLPSNSLITFKVNTTINSIANVKLSKSINTTFATGSGPGLVNAPVAPEAIYVGRSGSNPGLSVIDMNGFGQGTGDLATSNFPNNLNLKNPGVVPNISPGTSNLDAGGAGPLTLAADSNGSTLLVDSSVINQIEDIHIGQPLDKIFNNTNINAFATNANQVNPFSGSSQQAWGNSISVAPHPNPPKFVSPPPNPGRNIMAEEPSVTSATGTGGVLQTCSASPMNRMVIGNPFKKDGTQGIFYTRFPGLFNGPVPAPGSPTPAVPFCPYTCRQQIGHFLYVLDRGKKQILVLNSNRMQVLETIKMTDPVAMSISPNLKRLAVSNYSSNSVSFVDIDPASPTFHQIVKVTRVGAGPEGLAWQPEGEDLLVACRIDSSVYILRGTDLEVRKNVAGQVNNPIDVVVTCRQVGQGVGFSTGLYFAYILNGDSRGSITVFESGPDGVNGIGFDDTVGVPEAAVFPGATTMQVDYQSFPSAIWVAHRDNRGRGQVSHLELTSSPNGPTPITQNQGGGQQIPPTFRQRVWSVTGRLGGDAGKGLLSGDSPIDIALDDLNNSGALADSPSSQVSNLVYADHSGKSQIKRTSNGQTVPSTTPRFLLVALSDTGTVDVIEVDSGKIVKTIKATGVSCLSHYWRQ